MEKKEYLEKYIDYPDIGGLAECSGDSDFCVHCLGEFMEKEPDLLPALIRFHMKPEELLNLVEALGGAEFYSFPDLTVLKAMILLYKWTENTEPVHETLINYDVFKGILDTLGLNGYMPLYRKKGRITLDRALGQVIHAEHAKVLKEYLEYMPGGDDDYFDYYPGVMFYYSALTEWFLNSENRIT